MLEIVAALVALAPPPLPSPRRADRIDTLQVERGKDTPRLVRQADGSYTYRNAKDGLQARIRPDGSVEFRDVAPAAAYADFGQGWFAGFFEALQRPRGQRDRPDLEAQHANVDPSAAAMETVPWGPYGPAPILVKAGVRAGGIGSARGGRNTKKKADFLKATEQLRTQMAREYAAAAKRRRLLELGNELSRLWKRVDLTPAQRKRELFRIWDDIDDGEMADEARRRVETYVRLAAPMGSAHAFTKAELSRLNATRKSRMRFDPYAARPSPRSRPASSSAPRAGWVRGPAR